LEKDPNKRYQNASLLTADLVAIEQGQGFKEYEVSDNNKTIVANVSIRSPKQAYGGSKLSTIIWAAVILIIGFLLGFFSARMLAPKERQEATPVSKAPEKIGPFDYVKLPTGMEAPEKNLFTDLDTKPFSTCYSGGKKRVFEFPKQEYIASICDAGWTTKAVAHSTVIFDPFQPLYLSFGRELCASPNIFKKFRPDEVRGIRLFGFLSNLGEILETVSGYSNLESIGLESSTFEKANMPTLMKMKKLKELSVKGTQVTGKDLTQLTILPQLRNLDCSGISDISPLLEKLKGSKNLENLSISTCALSRQDLQNIAQLPNLVYLDLTNNAIVSDKTLSLLLPLKKLSSLDLEDCAITKASCPIFKAMPALKRIHLSTKHESQEQTNAFKNYLSPRVDVKWKLKDSS